MNVIEITAEKETAQETIRLAAYCRVSSDSEDQLHSFAAQIRYYKDYERRNPQYKLVDIYADEGITGTCMAKRDDLHRLIRDCKKGLIDRIIVKSVSRFARNTSELLTLLLIMWKPSTRKKPRLSWMKKQSCRSSLTASQVQSKNVKTQNPGSTKSS